MASYPKKGDRVTVVVPGFPTPQRTAPAVVVRRRQRRVFMARRLDAVGSVLLCSPDDEGWRWARGWNTGAAQALKAVVALGNCQE